MITFYVILGSEGDEQCLEGYLKIENISEI